MAQEQVIVHQLQAVALGLRATGLLCSQRLQRIHRPKAPAIRHQAPTWGQRVGLQHQGIRQVYQAQLQSPMGLL